jgi:hypothetical protein
MAKVKKVKLSMTRDETTVTAEFFPLWVMICESKLRERNQGDNWQLSWTVFKCIIEQMQQKFDKRLQQFAKHHIFAFSPAESAIFIQFLMKHPISADNFFLWQLRKRIIDTLHVQL